MGKTTLKHFKIQDREIRERERDRERQRLINSIKNKNVVLIAVRLIYSRNYPSYEQCKILGIEATQLTSP